MPALIDARPAGIDLLFRQGTTLTLTLNWPADSLDGRSFSSTLGAANLSVAVNGDVMTIEVTDVQTTAVASATEWLLLEDVDGTDEPILVGTWAPSDSAAATSSATVTVTQGSAQVDVTVLSSAATARPPVTVIAAADAPDAVKARADVVCDGVDDNVEIQAAVTAGPVLLSEGTFLINGHAGQRLTLPSNSVLRGQGPQQTVIRLQPADLGNSTLFPVLDSWGVVQTVGDDENLVYDVTIADLTVDGNEQNMLSNGNANQGECINIKYGRRIKITNVHVVNGNAEGFDFDLSSGVLTNVSAVDCRGSGIHLSGGVPVGADHTATRWVVVQGADIENCGWDHARNAFDITQDSAYCVLQGITARGNYATCTVSGNRNVIADLIADDGLVTISGDENVLDNFQVTGGTNMGLGRGLLVSGLRNLISNGRISAFSGWFLDGTNNRMVNVDEIAFAAPEVGASAVNARLTNCRSDGTPTTSSASTRWSQSWCNAGASENRGTGTILNGQSTLVVSHGVWAAPTSVVVTPRGSVVALAVTARTATTFTVSRSGTSGALDFDWEARL
jgi:hypothetical protein